MSTTKLDYEDVSVSWETTGINDRNYFSRRGAGAQRRFFRQDLKDWKDFRQLRFGEEKLLDLNCNPSNPVNPVKKYGSSNILVGKRSQTFRRRHYAYWLLDAYPCLMLLRAFTGSPEQEAGAAPEESDAHPWCGRRLSAFARTFIFEDTRVDNSATADIRLPCQRHACASPASLLPPDPDSAHRHGHSLQPRR